MTNKQSEKKRGLKLVEKYENDDYSRYAAPDYTEEPFQQSEEEIDFENSAHQNKQNIRIRPEGNWSHPGVSGKSDDDRTWVNSAEYREQASFVGYGPKNYKRSDDRIFEEACETLMKHHSVDASNIGVKVNDGVVYLSGKVESRRMKKIAELIIEDLPGVQDVRNELNVIREEGPGIGPESVTRKDLGIN
jgi:hypothetical protein